MFQTLKEMFRDQPHLASITLIVCAFSIGGLVYLLIDYINRLQNRSAYSEPVVEPVLNVPEPIVVSPERKVKRIPAAGKPKYVRIPRKTMPVIAEFKTEPERIYHYITREPGSPGKELAEADHRNLLRDAVKQVVNVEVMPKKNQPDVSTQVMRAEIETAVEVPKNKIVKGKRVRRRKKAKQEVSTIVNKAVAVEEVPSTPIIEPVVNDIEIEASATVNNVEVEMIGNDSCQKDEAIIESEPLASEENAVPIAETISTDQHVEEQHSIVEEAVQVKETQESIKASDSIDSMLDALREAGALSNVTMPIADNELETPVKGEAINNVEETEEVQTEIPKEKEEVVVPQPSLEAEKTSLPIVTETNESTVVLLHNHFEEPEVIEIARESLQESPEKIATDSALLESATENKIEHLDNIVNEVPGVEEQESVIADLLSDEPEISFESIPSSKDLVEVRRVIGYQPSTAFEQADPWSYPYVTMPAAGSEVWMPRPLRFRLSRSSAEEMFQLEMRRTFPAFEIAGDDCIPDPTADRPHECDISLIIKGLGLNLFIDVEIDEPYNSSTQKLQHLIGEDQERDAWFNIRGWIVIRLAESQVKSQPKHCLAYIARVIHSVYPEYHIPSHLKKLPDPKLMAQWTYAEAEQMRLQAIS